MDMGMQTNANLATQAAQDAYRMLYWDIVVNDALAFTRHRGKAELLASMVFDKMNRRFANTALPDDNELYLCAQVALLVMEPDERDALRACAIQNTDSQPNKSIVIAYESPEHMPTKPQPIDTKEPGNPARAKAEIPCEATSGASPSIRYTLPAQSSQPIQPDIPHKASQTKADMRQDNPWDESPQTRHSKAKQSLRSLLTTAENQPTRHVAPQRAPWVRAQTNDRSYIPDTEEEYNENWDNNFETLQNNHKGMTSPVRVLNLAQKPLLLVFLKTVNILLTIVFICSSIYILLILGIILGLW